MKLEMRSFHVSRAHYSLWPDQSHGLCVFTFPPEPHHDYPPCARWGAPRGMDNAPCLGLTLQLCGRHMCK